MGRPVTLFTGQWADLPLAELAPKVAAWGYDGLELACWGDHFEVDRAVADAGYAKSVRARLDEHGLGVWALGAHLVGQAVCDPIDERHRGILPPDVFGDGDPEGVRRRAAERMADTARAAAALGVQQVNGFTGSSIWHLLYSFPPNDFERGRARATRTSPSAGGRSSTCSIGKVCASASRCIPPRSPTTSSPPARRSTRSTGDPRSGSTSTRPTSRTSSSTPAAFALEFADRIYHVHVKDSVAAPGRPPLDPRLAPELRRRGPRLGLRLARPRRRRLRRLLPGAEPDRIHRAALGRVGGLGHGSRVRGAGRARLRAAHRLPRVGASPSTRRCSGRRTDDGGRDRVLHDGPRGERRDDRRDRRRDARVRLHGEGALERVPDARVHGLAAAAPAAARGDRGSRRERGHRGGAPLRVRARTSRTGATSWRTRRSASSTTAARTTFTQSRPSRRPRRASTSSARSPSAATRPSRSTSGSASRRRESCTCAPSTTASSRPCGSRSQLIESGELGEIRHFRGRYLQEWGATDAEAWRFEKDRAGSGALGDLGDARRRPRALPRRRDRHASRRSPRRSSPAGRSTTRSRPPSGFENGAVGTIEATRFATGAEERVQLGDQRLEGLAGIRPRAPERAPDQRGNDGFRTRLVSEADDPFWSWWWPHGHMIGWEHTFVHELHHLLDAIAGRHDGRSARRHVRGRLPRLGGLRRDPPLRRDGPPPDGGVPLARRSLRIATASRSTSGAPRGGRSHDG